MLLPSKIQNFLFERRINNTNAQSYFFSQPDWIHSQAVPNEGLFSNAISPRTTGQGYLLNRRGDYQMAIQIFFLMDGLNAQLKRANPAPFPSNVAECSMIQDCGKMMPRVVRGWTIQKHKTSVWEKGWCGGRSLGLAARRERKSQGKEIRRGGTNCEEKTERIRWLPDSWSL